MENQEQIHGPEEISQLELLRDVEHVIAEALKSLPGKNQATPESAYLGWAAVSVHRAAEAYLYLRNSGRVAASKLLVRPALEATFSGKAVADKEGFLFRKLHSELEEDNKMFRVDGLTEKEAQDALNALKATFRLTKPGTHLDCRPLNMAEVARIAGFSAQYDSLYRKYCKFTHGALWTVVDGLENITEEIDTPTVIWCVLVMLDLLQSQTPAEVPDLAPFWKRLSAIPKPQSSPPASIPDRELPDQ